MATINSQSERIDGAPFFRTNLVSFARSAPGLLVSILLAIVATISARVIGVPVMLSALVLGVVVSPFASQTWLKPGISFSAKHILYLGVILLGARMTFSDITSLGPQTVLLVGSGVLVTLGLGWLIGRSMRLSSNHAILSAGAVAICGGSAALAICAVLPKTSRSECETVMTVLCVTLLSTLAMVLYPALTTFLGFSETEAGVFMGATIHNVAQVVGAGHIVSEQAAETATVVKLMRVSCLVPVVILISILAANQKGDNPNGGNPPFLPTFLIGFLVLMAINSTGVLSTQMSSDLGKISNWALVISVAALGAQTPVRDVLRVGPKAIAAMTIQTAILAILAAVALGIFITL